LNIFEFAAILNGREMGKEITKEEELQAKELGFVVIFGYSDDHAELRGFIYDEVGCYNGGEILLNKDGLFEDCECECKYSLIAKKKTRSIKVICNKGKYFWTYETSIPHATFDVFEDGQPWCEGIVFDIKEIEKEEK